EGLEKSLADRRHVHPEFAHAVVDDGGCNGRTFWGFVLNNLQCADARALNAPPAQEQTTIACRSQDNRASCRQIGIRIEIFGNADGISERGGVNVVAGIEVDAANKLDQLSGVRQIMTAGLVEGLAN